MSIRPIEVNGMIQRAQDVGQIKQQEDQKPLLDQQNIQIQAQKELEQGRGQVAKTEKTDEEFLYDAKQKGGSSSSQSRNKKKKGNNEVGDGKVIKKMSGGFDIKI